MKMEEQSVSYAVLKDICVSYDKKVNVLENLSLEIKEGELVSLLGPSGCGKTTTLRVVAGFIEPSSGEFLLGAEDITNKPVHKRDFGIVFQSYALFPHMSVYDNVAFGLKMQKANKEEIKTKVMNMLEVCDLIGFEKRFPKQLSGGQRQRVALARALVTEPKLLLLDEPLSNLDAKLRLQMRVEIRRIQKALNITTIFVTHDQEECFSISDRVAIMNKGVIEQYDTPENIYSKPKTEYVARFIGFTNFVSVTKTEGVYRTADGSSLNIDGAELTQGVASIRPEDITLANEAQTENVVTGKVTVRTFLGRSYELEVSSPFGELVVDVPIEKVYEPGDEIKLHLPSHKIVLL